MKALGIFIVFLLAFLTYIVFTGSTSPYDVVTGFVAALITGLMFSYVTVKNPAKVFNHRRWLYAIIYAFKYIIVYETLAHVDVIKRILHPKVPVNPAVVKVPFYVKTDYGITAVANSITNTPGTVVLEVDQNEGVFYVHWIDAKTLEPIEARKQISEAFEEYCKKIFE
ncbi:MAG: Na+/H+ antiporter subunit E [Ignisphaera sp.]